MSLPSSSARGFCLTTVARAGELAEKARACRIRDAEKECEGGSCPLICEVTVLRAIFRLDEVFARHCWKKAAAVCVRVTHRGILIECNVGSDIVQVVFGVDEDERRAIDQVDALSLTQEVGVDLEIDARTLQRHHHDSS
jgi:hypothetical protein